MLGIPAIGLATVLIAAVVVGVGGATLWHWQQRRRSKADPKSADPGRKSAWSA
jgi:hypothetical protein